MFNLIQYALEACPNGYDGDGYIAHRILRWKFEITDAFDVLAIEGECWTGLMHGRFLRDLFCE